MTFDTVFAILVIGSFLASLANAMFSIGGALIVLALSTTVLPISAVVPIHSTLMIGSTVWRVPLFWEHINWSIVRAFTIGSAIGAAIGARIFIELPETIVGTAIGVLMLVAMWLPAVKWRPKSDAPWLVVGLGHTFFSTIFAYGAILHAFALFISEKRKEVIGTMAGCLVAMSIFKISGYIWVGFDYMPYLHIVVASFLVSFLGSWVGKRIGEFVSEPAFRLTYRVLVTITALRLIYVAWFA
ncbi:MAG: sulfite exporter TauE/SafE family protein [Pseudomonadota bacterium]